MDMLKTDEEFKPLVAKLKDYGLQLSFCADVADTCNIRKVLNSWCQMLHYPDHANGKVLEFESSRETECGVAEPLGTVPMKNIGDALVEAGVPHVVAVKKGQSVFDQAAVQFADLFYDALINNSGMFTVREAFDTALKSVDTSHLIQPKEKGDRFLLLPKDGNHNVRIFNTLLEGDFIDRIRYPPQTPPRERAASKDKDLEGLEQRLAPTLLHNLGNGELKAKATRVDYGPEKQNVRALSGAASAP
eukprot:g18932.t1